MQLNPATAGGRRDAGTKITCVGCSARFYDLNRLPPRCPKCQAEQPPIAPRVTHTRAAVSRATRWRPAAAADVDHPPAREAEAEDAKDTVEEVPELDSEDSEPDAETEDEAVAD